MSEQFHWCEVHNRQATEFKDGVWRCDGKLGGIAMPCKTIKTARLPICFEFSKGGILTKVDGKEPSAESYIPNPNYITPK